MWKSMWSSACAVAAVALGLVLGSAAQAGRAEAADRVEEFYGTWLPVDQPAKCAEVEEWGEGPQIIIRENYYEDGEGECEEVSLHMHEGRLRISGSCGGEGGYRPLTQEFALKDASTLEANGKAYNRCRP